MVTVREALENDSIEFGKLYDSLYDKGMGNWDNINSTDTIHDYINEMMRQGISVSHILTALEVEICETGYWEIWLGNSMETPSPINTKKELTDALGLWDDESLDTELDIEVI